MYLKRLEMKGFKSFPDKIEIEFDTGVTCVVGPNGSGKSNITDAVRWVLGEQKVKTLRGSKMEDIIFNGTRHRKPLGIAEVSLVFDNTDRKLSVDYGEVKVTRKIFRSGDTEYLLNDTPCRLKDIRDVFMDTGIGVDGYSIIGQGKIESILSTRNEDRRLVFEEAAGIVKFRQRKRESERKLEAAVQNLLRIEDILRELEQRVGPLEEQSIKAQTYLTLSGELKNLEVNQMIREIEEAVQQAANSQLRWNETSKALQEAQSALDSLGERLEETRLQTELDQTRSREMAQIHFQAISKVQELENRIETLKSDSQREGYEVQRIADTLEDYALKMDEILEEIARLEAEKIDLDRKQAVTEHALSDAEQAIQKCREDNASLEQNQTQNREAMIGHLNSIERKKAEIRNLSQMQLTMQNRMDQVDHERILEQTKEQNKTVDSDVLQAELEEIRDYVDNISHKKQDATGSLFQRKTELSGLTADRDKYNKRLTELEAERRLLQEMEDNYQGYGESVRNVLKACGANKEMGSGVHGVVADLLKIPERYETAVDVILGKSLQNIVVDSESDARRLIRHMKERSMGRATFLPLRDLKDSDDNSKQLEKLNGMAGFIGRASDLVKCEEPFKKLLRYLLDRVVIVESLDHAGAMMQFSWLRFRIVTLEGDLFIPGGAITGGSMRTTKTGLLSRKRRITEIAGEAEQIKGQYESVRDRIEEMERTVGRLEREVLDMNRVMDERKLDLARKEEQARQVETDLETAQGVLHKLEMEKNRLKIEIEQTGTRIQIMEQEIQEHEADGRILEKNLMENGSILEKAQRDLTELQEKQTQMRVLRATQKEKVLSLGDRLTSEQRRQQDLEALINASNQQKGDIVLESENRKQLLVQFLAELEASRLSVDTCLSSLNDHDQESEDRKKRREELMAADAELRGKTGALSERLSLCEQEKVRSDGKQESMITALWEKYELSWLEALDLKVDWEEAKAQKRIRELRKDIRDLGDVNLGAVAEFAEVKERFEFLRTQREDLTEAEKGLRRIIRDLDKAMRAQFTEAFEKVRGAFQELFSELFAGGTADVILSDPQEPLDCEITIVAQPPGKKLQSLELMSGGEKSLTAIALLFAILKNKPSPFCMLDEIEAALDDVNVWRFAEFLKHFTSHSQFIVITHRKGTMEIADTLYGVTMEEYGVSRILSVKMEEIPV